MAQQTFEELVDAVKQAESRGKRYAADGKTLTTSPKGALGEMQVMPKTIKDPGFGVTPAKSSSPDEIARVGVDYLQAMKQKYGDTEKALIAYNWGPGSTDKWLASGADPKKLPAETRTYVERVKGFLGKDVPRETTVAKKEREPLPASLPPMAQADIKSEVRASSVKPEAAARVASLGPGYQAALALSFLADTDDEEDRKTTITQEYLAKAQEDEDGRAAAAAVNKRQANVFADLSNTTIRSPFAEPQQPVRMKEGGDVGDRLTPQQIEQYVGQKTKAQLLLEKFKEQAHPRNYTSIIGLGPNIVYETYKYATGKDPLRELQKELQKKIDYEVDTGSEPIGTDSGPISGSLPPIRRAEGSPEEGEDLTKPSFGNPNIRKQGEAARRLAAMRDVNTLPDPKTYAAVAGVLGTRPDQMGFSVLNPKYKEIMDVANPAFYAGTALQIAPAVQALGGGKAAKMLGNMAGQEFNAALMGERPGTLLDMFTAPAQPKFMFVRARPEAAARHADLQAQGLSPEQIRAQNLTLVDNRGNLLEEISDAPAVLQQKTASVQRMYYDMLKHPELESIYPGYDMPFVQIGTTRRKDAPLASASFGEREGIQGTVRSLPGDDVRGTVRGTLLHEGQHAIQSIEGFTEGANPSSFVAYIKAKRGTYNEDPTVNENVIRGMERIYPNLPEVTDRIGQDLKARYGKVFPSDRRVGEALYRHMPGEVQADLARIRGNLTPEELKATPLEASMQQLNINPANILEMNKGGSRLDRQIGDLEYDVYGYAQGGPVYRAEGSPEEGEVAPRLTMQQIERLAAQEAAEREAASTPAFIAQKSGIGRKAGPISQALQSGQGYVEAAKGLTMMPQNFAGAAFDLSNMVAGLYGGNVDKPIFGSENLKEQSRKAGLAFKPSNDPTLAAFFGAGDLGSNLVNPAGLTRTGVRAAGAVAEKAGDAARDFQQYNQQLAVPGASYVSRPPGGYFPTSYDVDYPATSLDKSITSVVELIKARPSNTPEQVQKSQALMDLFNIKLKNYYTKTAGSIQDPLRKDIFSGALKFEKDSEMSDKFPSFLIDEAKKGNINALRMLEQNYDSMVNINPRIVYDSPNYRVIDTQEIVNNTIIPNIKNNIKNVPDSELVAYAGKIKPREDGSIPSVQEAAIEIRKKIENNPNYFSIVLEPNIKRIIKKFDNNDARLSDVARMPESYGPQISKSMLTGNVPPPTAYSQPVLPGTFKPEFQKAVDEMQPIYEVDRYKPVKPFGKSMEELYALAETLPTNTLLQTSFPDFLKSTLGIEKQVKKEKLLKASRQKQIEEIPTVLKENKIPDKSLMTYGVKDFLNTKDGMRWVEVTEPDGVLPIAKAMDNSLASYAASTTYGSLGKGVSALKNEDVKIYSLYDQNNIPQVVIEYITKNAKIPDELKAKGVKQNSIAQLTGNGPLTKNQASLKFGDQIADFANELKLTPDEMKQDTFNHALKSLEEKGYIFTPEKGFVLFDDLIQPLPQRATGGMIERKTNDNRRYL